jgi:hypothetical protein
MNLLNIRVAPVINNTLTVSLSSNLLQRIKLITATSIVAREV